jgi:NAD(P)-dependent dehydrogenase (short-subunit alcohol dehydrogenase family)
MELAGKVVLITGAARGIGAAMARRFAAEGAAGLLLADVEGPGVDALAEQLTATGTPSVARTVDVADREAVLAMVAATEERFGGLDLLCSNAGIGTGQGLEADPETWERAWRINVLAHVHAAEAAIPGMVERGGGYVLATCSAAGLLTMVGDAPYSVTKHAAVAFAEWLAVTYGGQGVRVSALCPQGVATALLDGGEAGPTLSSRIVRSAAEVLQPEDVARCVVEGLATERFLILPHAEVADHYRKKATDPDRWIGALQRFAATVEGGG